MSNITENLIDDCYSGYCALEDNPLSKEEWIKLPQAKQFISRMKRIQKMRNA